MTILTKKVIKFRVNNKQAVHTLWKFQDFSVSDFYVNSILGIFEVQKVAVFADLEALNFVY